MMFTRHLRPRVASGEICCSVRVWHRPRVKVGGRYRMQGGAIIVTSVREIAPGDLTDALARESGIADVADLLSTVQHGAGDNIYLVRFRFEGGAQ